ncbi:MAG: hypothetical protein ACM65M_13340 [Microcoleus sp.]
MALRDDIEQWRTKVAQLLEAMDEVRACADRLSECPASELGWKFSTLLEMCEESLSQVERLREELAEIQSRWGFGNVRRLPVKTIAGWDKWQRGLQDKLPRKENYSKDLKTLLNTWKGDNWGFFVEQQLSFEQWHLEGKIWAKEDIDSPYLPSVITRPKDPRTEAEKECDRQMLKVTNVEGSKVQYDAVIKKDRLDPSLAKEVAEFKLRETSTRINQAKIQAEDLAVESAKQGKPSRIAYYFYEKPSDKEINKLLGIYKMASEKHHGASVEVQFLFAEDGDR